MYKLVIGLFLRIAKDVMEIMVRALFCVELHELSLLYFLWYVNGGGGIYRMTAISNGAQVGHIT